MTAVQNVLDRLKGVRQTPAGWVACCPAHEDRTPSLSVGQGDDGRVLLTCHAGCDLQAIVSSLGLEMKDLFPPDVGVPRSMPVRAGLNRPRLGQTSPTGGPRKPLGIVFDSADACVRDLESKRGPSVARWKYHNPAGTVVGLAVR